jgi:hypothetical protein
MTEKYDHIAVSSSKFTEGSCLPLKKGCEGLKGVACLELASKWMSGEVCPRTVSVLPAGSLKKSLKKRRFQGSTHVVD